MKKFFSLILCLCLLLSLTACSTEKDSQKEKEEEKITVYLVTGTKSYYKNELSSSATMEYDKKGRPTVVSIQMSNGHQRKSEIAYDKNGNKVQEIVTAYMDGKPITSTYDYALTYDDGKMIRCDCFVNEEAKGGFDLEYDEYGRLILIDYDEEYTLNNTYTWHNFAYDNDGRLIQENRCIRYNYQPTGHVMYQLVQCRYEYNTKNTMYFSMGSNHANVQEINPGDEEGLELQEIQNSSFTYFYNKSGELVGALAGKQEKSEFGNKPDIFEDDRYTFDENGNLLAYENGESRTEYTYTKVKLTQKEAEISMRMRHGIAEGTNAYAIYGPMDPIYVDTAPLSLYHPVMYSSVYYLIPYPQWGAPSGK